MRRYILFISIKTVIITVLIALLHFIAESNAIKIFFSVLFSFISILVDNTPYLKPKEDEPNNQSHKIKVLKYISITLNTIILIIAILGNTLATNKTETTHPETNTTVPNSHVTKYNQPQMYHFNTITLDEKYDIYFMDSPNQSDLYSDLSNSLRNIKYRTKPTKEQLEGNNSYGNNALSAAHYEQLLKDELNNKYANATDINKNICNTAINISEMMDAEYDTPDNRKRIIRLTKMSYENGLSDNTNDTQNMCIRYAWGLLYTEISYDQYNEDTITLLIELYEHIYSDARSLIIVSALKEIKTDFHSNVPHPQKNIK